jgi:hypothetical protein
VAPKTKFDKAVDRARDGESESETVAVQRVVGGDVTGMIVPSDTIMESLSAKVASGEWEAAPQIVSIEKGQTLIAMLEGNGPEAEFSDRDTGIVSTVKTWVLSKNGVRVSILSTAQLDKKLPPFVGGEVSITRGEDKKFSGGIYTEYLVLGPKRADGKARNWATKPQLPAAGETSNSGVG